MDDCFADAPVRGSHSPPVAEYSLQKYNSLKLSKTCYMKNKNNWVEVICVANFIPPANGESLGSYLLTTKLISALKHWLNIIVNPALMPVTSSSKWKYQKIKVNYYNLLITWWLGKVLKIITPPNTTGMHRETRVSFNEWGKLYIKFLQQNWNWS